MTKSTKPQFVVRPTAYRAWNGHQMIDVQTLSWNAGGMLWHGAGGQMGWAWINPEFNGWTKDNPKPSEGDIYPVMQWTGLKTKDGQDVWEGDIVEYMFEIPGIYKAPSSNRGQVVYNPFRFGFEAIDNVRLAESGDPVWIPLTNDSVRIVGNVFQNPELLET